MNYRFPKDRKMFNMIRKKGLDHWNTVLELRLREHEKIVAEKKRYHERMLASGGYEDDEKNPEMENPNRPDQIVEEEDMEDIVVDDPSPPVRKKKDKKIPKPEKIPKLSIEDDLINGMLGREEKPYEPDFSSLCEQCDDDSMDSMDALRNDDCECLFTDEEDGSVIEEDIGHSKSKQGQRNLSKLKPWEKTLPEFVVGHMSHSPCGPKVPYGTNRRCWVNGKCKGMYFKII